MNKIFDSPVRTGAFLSLCVLIVYFTTLAPSVGFIDSGELAAVASTLGVAHPTGYPLFTLIGWMFANVPVGSEEIVRLNAMAAIFCAVGVFLFFLISLALFGVQEFSRPFLLFFLSQLVPVFRQLAGLPPL